jgi:hypothetical protein
MIGRRQFLAFFGLPFLAPKLLHGGVRGDADLCFDTAPRWSRLAPGIPGHVLIHTEFGSVPQWFPLGKQE